MANFFMKKKFLIITASGMGCTVMFTPTLRALRQRFPDAHITILGISKIFVAPVAGSDLVDEALVFDFAKDSLFQISKLGERLKFIRNLRKQKFDYSITVFPSNKWFFNVFAWLSGAKKRITHRYSTPVWKNLSFLQNVKIPVDEDIHDVDQNLNLLKVFKIDPAKANRDFYFHITQEDKKVAERAWQQKIKPGLPVVGMHVGSSQDYASVAKRWPTEKFAGLADRLQSQGLAQVVVFAGPDEAEEVEKMESQMKTTVQVIPEKLGPTADLIGRCQVMVSNDSGLMHMAVAMKTPVVGIMGPTIVSRTKPYANAKVIYDPKCHSLTTYPFKTTSAKLDPEAGKKCFVNIGVDKVFEAVNELLNAN